MFWSFLGISAIAATFTQLGILSTKLAVMSLALEAMAIIALVATLLALAGYAWTRFK